MFVQKYISTIKIEHDLLLFLIILITLNLEYTVGMITRIYSDMLC